MASKDTLTNNNTANNVNVLTKSINIPFKIVFSKVLHSGYHFDKVTCDAKKANNLLKWLGVVVGKPWNEVEKQYLRKTDKDDKYEKKQIIHFQYNGNGRIHGFIDLDGSFVVRRIDPNHSYHKD